MARRVSVFRVAANVRSGLWFVPVMCVVAGVVLSFVTLWIDERSGYDLIPRSFTGGPDAALTILGAVATSMVSLAALVLTITMVVVQLAMGQFSPRIVQPILKDKPSQFAIGIFVGTFAFAMLAMRQVLIGQLRHPARCRASRSSWRSSWWSSRSPCSCSTSITSAGRFASPR